MQHRSRLDPFGAPIAKPAKAPSQSVLAHSARVTKKHSVRFLTPLLGHARWALQNSSPRAMSPTVAVTSITVFGFVLIMLFAAAFSPSFRNAIPNTPLIAAVESPIAKAINATNDSDNEAADAVQPNGATEGIPASAAALYIAAAQTCNMPWEVLAAVGRIETNHGQSNAAGVHSGANYAGAEGPMQFLPGTWAHYGIDADHNGKADIYDQTDAVYSAANYLCANGARDDSNMQNALIHYNHSQQYVNTVLDQADSYKDDAYVMPISAADSNGIDFGAKHHDYPADDIDMPVGTQVYAVRGGTADVSSSAACGNTLIINGTDGYTYTYCHAQSIQVHTGEKVDTGEAVLKSGGAAGAAGAGDSTGPHLHLQITVHGTNVCPQPLLADWASGQFESPADAPTSGCFY